MKNRYICVLRPASFATLPSGIKWDYVEIPRDLEYTLGPRRPDLPISRHRHGVIEIDRRLTAEECQHFDLELVPDALTPAQRLENVIDLVDGAINLPDDPRERCHAYARVLLAIRRAARGR